MISNSSASLVQITPTNRAMRRRLKRSLKLPFTPSVDFAVQYLEKMTILPGEAPEASAPPLRRLATKPAFKNA